MGLQLCTQCLLKEAGLGKANGGNTVQPLHCENGHLFILASTEKLGIPSVALTSRSLESDCGLPPYLVPLGLETSSRLLPTFYLSPPPTHTHLMLGLCCWICRKKWARR